MPETERKLVLHSPAGSEHVEYRWPLNRTETWDEAVEIVETIRWVCRDFPDLKLAVEKFVLNSFEPTSYESMKQLCERYNRAVDNIKKLWSGRQPPPGIDAPPSIPLLRHIINQAYNRAVTKPEDLNSYEPFSPEVYGETSFELVSEVIKQTKMTENDVFIDLGSGIGQVVLQVCAQVGCKCYGIEKADIPAKYAERMEEEFVRWMEWYGKSYGEFELLKGDFLDPFCNDILQSATVVFTNNFAFGPKLNHELKMKFANLKDGTKIVSSHEFCPLNFRITPRNLSDIGSIMHVAELSPLKGNVSWTGKPVSYYLHTLDRGKLEKFFLRQKHPEEYKSESSSHTASASSDDSSDSSSSESNDDEFEDALRKIKLSHQHRSSKKSLHYHPSAIANSKPGMQRKSASKSRDQQTKRRRQNVLHLKSDHHNSSAVSSSAMSSPSFVDMDALFSSFQHQLEGYMGQLSTPGFQGWVTDAIEKEKMKKTHLQGVINHLEAEVSGLARETVDQMKENMKELGITKMTPDGLLLGAKSIVSQNKQLRKELTELEKEISSLREQNEVMEAMCMQKTNPKLLNKLPLFGPEGDVMTNGIGSPHHIITDGEFKEHSQPVPLELKTVLSLAVEEEQSTAAADPKTADLVREYEIDLEKIDQQLLELGPYAQDAYVEDTPKDADHSSVAPLVELRRGKRVKPAAQGKLTRRSSRAGDDPGDPQRGWREVVELKQEEKEAPKKKWRKVGSAGPVVRGREGQLDAQSDPLNVSSASIIPPASEIEMRALYLPGQSDFGAAEDSKHGSPASRTERDRGESRLQPTGPQRARTPDSDVRNHPRVEDTQTPVIMQPSRLVNTSVATTAHSTPDCNTSSPSDTPSHPRAQPTAQWHPLPAKLPGAPQPHGSSHLLMAALGHRPQQVSMESAGASEEVDVTRVENNESQSHQLSAAEAERISMLSSELQARQEAYASPTHPHLRKELQTGSPSSLVEALSSGLESRRTSTPSPGAAHHGLRPSEVPEPHSLPQHAPTGGNAPRQPGFSIAQLTRAPEYTSVQSPAQDMRSSLEHGRGGSIPASGERSTTSPHGELETSLLRKRRSSSTSSHRSVKQHSFDDNASVRSGSPLSVPTPRGPLMPVVMRGEWGEGGMATPPPTSHESKPSILQSSAGAFPMWPGMTPVPSDGSLPSQVQRYPLPTPFLSPSHPWLRGGMIPGLPFRPALYPAAAAAAAASTLDPNNPYKPMLGLPYYPFAPAGLKPPFPTPTFSTSSSAGGSQPQTPSSVSSTPGFTFGQYPLPTGPGVGALQRGMNEVQSRLSVGTPPLVQHSLTGSKDSKQTSVSPEAPQELQQQPAWPLLPGMQLLQTPFGFGVQNPLVSSVGQPSLLGSRGAMPLSSSPLTLATQSLISAPACDSPLPETHHQIRDTPAGKRSKKQSGSTIDLTAREPVIKHIEAPSPQEAVKMATQRMSPFHEQSRDSPKWRGAQDAAQVPPSSSTLVPAFMNNLSSSAGTSQGPVLPYPVFSASGASATPMNLPGHLINPSQLMGVALPGGHMIPMGYTQALSSLSGKAEEGAGKKRSPKGGGGQKLRIHQMDFKNQGKVDRRRRRPWRTAEKNRREDEISASVPTKAKSVGAPPTKSTELPPSSVASEDTYALNMLADCSSKEGEKSKLAEEMSTSQQKQEMAAKRALMRSPGSLAGANSLLLLAKPDSASQPVSLPLKVAPPETAVVDGLLRLSNSSVPTSSVPTASSASQVSADVDKLTGQDGGVSESRSRLASMSAAEAMLMMGQKMEEGKKDRTLPGEEAETVRDASDVSKKNHASEEKRKNEVDSENTDTDSEATLSPASPAPPADGQWLQGPMKPQAEATPPELPETPNPPKMAETMLKGSLSSCSSDDSKIPPVSSSEVISVPQTTHERTQEEEGDWPSPHKAIPSPCGQKGKPLLQDAEGEWGMDPSSSKLGLRGSEKEERVEKEEKPLPDVVASFPTPPPPAQDEGDCDLDVEKMETVSADKVEPSQKETVIPASPKQEEKVLEKPPLVGKSPPPTEGDVVPSVPSPQLSPAASAGLETCEHEEREKPPSQPVTEEESESLLGPDTPPPAKRLRVEETADIVPEEEMEAEQVTPPPSCEAGVAPALPEPLTTASLNVPSADTPADSLSSEPQPPQSFSPAKLKEPEKVEKQDSSVSMEEGEKDGNLARSYRLEPLSPVAFSDEELTSHPLKDRETQLQDEPTTRDADERIAEQDDGHCAVEASTPVKDESEDLHPDPAFLVNHDVTGSGAREESTCISWPPDPGDVTMASEGEVSLSQKESTPISVTVSKTNTSPASSSNIEEAVASSGGVEQSIARGRVSKSISPTSDEKRSSSPKLDQRSPKSVPESSTSAVPSISVRKSSPPVAPQNRLPVGKSGFNRLQHRKAVSQHSQKQHSRDDKTSPGKKWSRPPETASRTWNLFEVDPQEGRRQKTEHRTGERDREQNAHSEGRRTKSPASRPPPPSHGHPSHTGNKQSVEKTKHGSRSPRNFGPEDGSHRQNRTQESRGHAWESREMGKPKGWQSGWQGSWFSPSSHPDHSPGHLRDREEASAMSDEEQNRSGRVRAHQNSHGWREDHQSQADHARDRGKHKSSYRGDSKQSSDHGGRKVMRIEKEKSHSSADQRKLPLSSAEPNHEEGGGGGGGYRRHREDDDEHSASKVKVAGARKRSYESVSDDELPEDSTRSSSRESSLVREERDRSERRSSLETAADLRSSQWRKERKRSAGLSDDGEDYSRASKHKKHKHSKDHKEHKERRKWRKTDGNDHKLKRNSEDKPWHSYHKH